MLRVQNNSFVQRAQSRVCPVGSQVLWPEREDT